MLEFNISEIDDTIKTNRNDTNTRKVQTHI